MLGQINWFSKITEDRLLTGATKTQQLRLFYNHASPQITCLVFYNLLVLKSYEVNDQIFNCHGNQASITN